MALKGFLASGFQQLIGASRLKGANTQWIGEPNRQALSSASNQITNTLNFGDNVLNYVGSGLVLASGIRLFPTNPTFSCRVTIVNNGTGNIILNGNSVISGGLVAKDTIYVLPKQSVILFYDLSDDRIYVESYPGPQTTSQVITVTNGLTTIALTTAGMQQVAYVLPGPGAVTANITRLTLTDAIDGQFLTLVGLTIGSNSISLIQDTTLSLNQGFQINGDFTFGNYSAITLVRAGTNWYEINRVVQNI